MKKFLIDMFSSNNEVSVKRVAAMFVLVNVVVLAYIATFKSKEGITPEFMYDSLCLIAGGGLGLTVIEKILTLKYKGNETPQDTNQNQIN